MKRFFLNGSYMLNAGPQNVNRSLVENADESMDYIKAKSRLTRIIERLWKTLRYNTIVFSGGVSKYELQLVKLMHKRMVYIMHGCSRYENVINRLNLSEKALQFEYENLRYADRIIAVSELYSNWIKEEYPEFAHKVTFVNNGIEINREFYTQKKHEDGNFSIAISGGNRPIKCNLEVCKAVTKLRNEGMHITVKAFGRFHDNGEPLLDYPFVIRMGQMEQDSYYKELKETDLFVVASDMEPFGLVVCDALNCGCSLLMSRNIGARSIFRTILSEDVLIDNHDTDEIASKIKGLLYKGNAKRLFHSVDINECSGQNAFLNLKRICIGE